jgi:mono/diheme cytochrome c family protein
MGRLSRCCLPPVALVCLLLAPASWAQADGSAESGARLFVQYGCGWCHEGGGRHPGKGPQLMHTKQSDDFLVNRIATGKPGKMPAFGGSLSLEQVDDLIAYIRSLEPES